MKRQDKFARGIIIFLFGLTIIASLLCFMMPLKDAHIPTDKITLTGKASEPNQITIAGHIDNTTGFTLKQITVVISTYNEKGAYIQDETVNIKVNLESKESCDFKHTFMATDKDIVAKAKLKDIECEYNKFAWYLILIPGFILTYLVKQLFANRKYYFDIEDKKVVVFASWRKAGVIVDGVLIKEGKLPKFKAEVSLFNMKIAGHKLKFYTLNGDIIPSIRALVDNKPVAYTKVRQNPFVKMMDEGVVRGKGDITMKSKYETDGEKAEKYNEQRFNKLKKVEDDEEIEDLDDLLEEYEDNETFEDNEKINKPTQVQAVKPKTSNLVACPYCNTMNKSSNLKCSGCGANLKK